MATEHVRYLSCIKLTSSRPTESTKALKKLLIESLWLGGAWLYRDVLRHATAMATEECSAGLKSKKWKIDLDKILYFWKGDHEKPVLLPLINDYRYRLNIIHPKISKKCRTSPE